MLGHHAGPKLGAVALGVVRLEIVARRSPYLNVAVAAKGDHGVPQHGNQPQQHSNATQTRRKSFFSITD